MSCSGPIPEILCLDSGDGDYVLGILSFRILITLFPRICPGQAFADASVWLAAANIIAAMDLGFAQDSFGHDAIPDAAFISGFVSHPKDFKCSFKPRNDKIPALIAHMKAVNIVTS